MSSRWPTLLTALTLLATITRAVEASGLSEAGRLSAVYDEILNARFDRARERLAAACPPAPPEACLALGLPIIWWQIVLDPDDRSRDARLEAASTAAIAAADAWTRREPRNAEAWFYLAGSYGPLVQLRVWRGQRLAAARDGNRIRTALERARSLDPTLHDAHFGVGLYHYYADVAPAAARMLRWLLLLPGGDRRQGLREMIETRDRGALLRGEADYQLHWLYLWYERQPQRALDLLVGLQRRYPLNPVFHQRVAEVQDVYFHDHPASAATWRALLARVAAGTISAPAVAEVRARLGLAEQLDAMEETDRAIEQIRPVIQLAPATPVGATARAQLLLGRAYDRIGERTRATDAYRTVLALTSAVEGAEDVRAGARAGLARHPDQRRTQAYRLSLEGWRSLEAGDLAEGRAALARARGLSPRDPTIAYRYARALVLEGLESAARGELERVLYASDSVPAVILASACVEYGVLMERSGAVSRAIEVYQRAQSIAGSDPRTRQAAEEALRRLGR